MGTMEGPGPGQYDVGKALEAVRPQRFRESSFSKASMKECEHEPSELGSNVSKMPQRVKGGVLREAVNDPGSQQTVTPGPEYCPPSSLRRSGAVYMGDPATRRRPSSAPAAGRYVEEARGAVDRGNPKAASSCPGWSFGTSRRDAPARAARAQRTPDTLYMPPSTLKTRAASCLNGHRPEGTAFLEMRPDPQTYSLEPPIAEPSGQSFTGARRWNSQPQISYIGPGTYRTEIPATIKGVVKMSSVQRFAENDPDDICPGPGAYHPESASRRGGGNQTTFARAATARAAQRVQPLSRGAPGEGHQELLPCGHFATWHLSIAGSSAATPHLPTEEQK